jgi:succinyl-CoA synthetase alpha subunit
MPVSVPVGGEAVEHVEVRRGEYHDSVTLMLAGRAVAGVAGAGRVLVAMATELNVALLAELGYSALAGVGPSDLIVAFTCSSPPSESAALEALTASLTPAPIPAPTSQPGGSITAPGHPHPDQAGNPAPRTMASALGRTGAPITLISTPGLASVAEAMESLEYGASPIIFSDNIPIEYEVRLKDEARRRGLLVMGPDCGTVVLHGTGLAFANVTRPGPISLVAASGTGAQELMALLDAAGTGIHHCLGVGGRDLTEQVAGRSTLAALTALAEDTETELITVVSKPPHPTIAARIKAHAATLPKPVHFAFVGPDHPTLTESAERILTALGHEPPTQWPHWPPPTTPGKEDTTDGGTRSRARARATTIRGLFSGGTLRAEAEAVLLRAGARKIDKRTSGGWGEGESGRLPTPTAAADGALGTAAALKAAVDEPETAWTHAANGDGALGTAAADEPEAVRTHATSTDGAPATVDQPEATHTHAAYADGAPGTAADARRPVISAATLPADVDRGLGTVVARMVSAEEPETARTNAASADRAPGTFVARTAAADSIPPAVTFDLTDFGDDAYTRGRPHPMIDNTLRLLAFAEAGGDAGVGVLLLDVVLGRGAHADPAGEVGAAIAGVRSARPDMAVVVSLCGTGGDPQGLVRQAEVLAGAGAWVFLSNAEAAGAAAVLARGEVLARGGVPGGAVDRH